MRTPLFLSVLLACLLLVTACSSSPSTPIDNQVAAQPSVPTTNVVAREYTVPVVLTTQFFNPKEIAVKVGDVVTLSVTAVDEDHVISAPSLGSEVATPNGVATPYVINVTKPGDIMVQCTDHCDENVALDIKAQ